MVPLRHLPTTWCHKPHDHNMNLECNDSVNSHVCHTSSYSLSFRLSVGRYQGQTIGLLTLMLEVLCGFPQSLQYIMYWNNCLNHVMTTSCLLVQEACKQTPIFQSWICKWLDPKHTLLFAQLGFIFVHPAGTYSYWYCPVLLDWMSTEQSYCLSANTASALHPKCGTWNNLYSV